MPSRAEGFGLVGLEAISMGVPVLVSMRSGIGELLLELAKSKSSLGFVKRFVIDILDDMPTDSEAWAQAIKGILNDREQVFQQTDKLRSVLLKTDYWQNETASLLVALEKISPIIRTTSSSMDNDQLSLAEEIFMQDPVVAITLATSKLEQELAKALTKHGICLLYTSPSPRDQRGSRMPSSA